MKPETVILKTADRLRKRAAIRMKATSILDSFFYGVAAGAAYTGLTLFSELIGFEFWVFSIPLLISLLAGVMKASRVKPDTQSLMAESDRRFELQERLSTAYELLVSEGNSALKPLQIKDAATHARGIDPLSFHPGPRLRWRLRHTLLAAILAAIVVLPHMSPRRSSWPGAPADFTGRDTQLGTQIELLERRSTGAVSSLTREKERGPDGRAEKPGHEGSDAVPGETEGDVSSQRATGENLSRIAQEAGGLRGFQDLDDDEVLRLTTELMGNQPGLFEPEEIKRLEEALRRGDTAALKEFLNKLGDDGEEVSRALRAMMTEPGGASGDAPDSEPGPERRGSSGPEGETGALRPSKYAGGIGSLMGEAAEREGGRRPAGGRQPGEERGPEAGAATPLSEERTDRGTRIKGKLSKGEILRGLVKSIPVRNPSNAPVGEVIAQYRHRAENAMERYELPPRYREYIKRYFLAIGLNNESEDK